VGPDVSEWSERIIEGHCTVVQTPTCGLEIVEDVENSMFQGSNEL
jgi:hypothetical protein